jgi:hypothetical protein
VTTAVAAPAANAPLRSFATRAGSAAGVAAAVAVAGVLDLHRPATLCPLRALTGIPCPVCGTTTGVARLVRGDLAGAFLANPVTMLVAAAFVVAPLVALRVPQRMVPALFTSAVGFAWVWQLARFDRIPF